MALLAFQIVRASQLNRIQPVSYFARQSGNGGSLQTITTTEADLLNCTVTFSTTTAANYIVWFFSDFEVTVVGASTSQFRISVDGSDIGGQEANGSGATLMRYPQGQVFNGTFAGAGSHTVKARVLKTAAAATMVSYDNHTAFAIQVSEIV